MSECRTCAEIPCTFPSDLELYSLDGLQFFLNGQLYPVIFCPPGYNCIPSIGGLIYMPCCNVILQRTVTAGMPYAQIQLLLQSMITECQGLGCGSFPPRGPIVLPPFYFNAPQTFQFFCSDLSSQFFTVPAGTFAAFTQAQADALAMSLAQRRLATTGACIQRPRLSGSPGWICLNFEVTSDPSRNIYRVTGSNSAANYAWSITSGALPTGVTLVDMGHDNSVYPPQAIAQLVGIPTVAGVYTYTVQAARVGFSGVVTQVTDVFSVFGITNPTLAVLTIGAPYSEQITTAGGTLPVTFALADGAVLPTGLTLHDDGLIDGTPTGTAGPFDVTITDADGGVCTQAVTIPFVDLGYYLCGWNSIEYALYYSGQLPCGGILNPDNRTHWNGWFDQKTTYSLGNNYPLYYFLGQSLFGTFFAPPGVAVSADQDALYPAGDWQNLGTFTQLYWNGLFWFLWITDVCGNIVWEGNGPNTLGDASGKYTNDGFGDTIVPLYIYVSKVTDAGNVNPGNCITACAGFTDIDWVCNPGTCRLRIAGYVDAYDLCLTYGAAGVGPIWDGTFPKFSSPGYGTYGDGVLANLDATVGGSQVIVGHATLTYDVVADVWTLLFGTPATWLWGGTHSGPSPIGVYNRDLAIPQCVGSPASFTIQGYTP
jgi:hypothetical protein